MFAVHHFLGTFPRVVWSWCRKLSPGHQTIWFCCLCHGGWVWSPQQLPRSLQVHSEGFLPLPTWLWIKQFQFFFKESLFKIWPKQCPGQREASFSLLPAWSCPRELCVPRDLRLGSHRQWEWQHCSRAQDSVVLKPVPLLGAVLSLCLDIRLSERRIGHIETRLWSQPSSSAKWRSLSMMINIACQPGRI